jgi:hypothetical protein
MAASEITPHGLAKLYAVMPQNLAPEAAPVAQIFQSTHALRASA